MRKASAFLATVMVMLIWFSFASPTILDTSHSIEPDNSLQADWWENMYLTTAWWEATEMETNDIQNTNQTTITRTVIPAVPKTGPSGNWVWIILATLAIFGGYIYIKKRADI